MSELNLSVIVHPHPIIEMQITNFKMDDVGHIADCIFYNKESNKIETSFFLDENMANEIILLMQAFINNCKI